MLQKVKQEIIRGKTLLQFGFLSGMGQALTMLVPLIAAKFFSEELFGSYSLAKMLIFFFITLLIAASHSPFVVFANQEKTQTGKINKSFSVQCTFLFFSLAVFPLLCLAFSGAIKWFAAISAVDILYIVLGYTGLSLKLFLGTLFMGLGQKTKSALVELVFGVSSVLFIIVFWMMDRINLRSVLLIYLLSAIAVIIVSIFMLDIKLLLPIQFDRKHFLEMFHSTKWLIFGAFSVYLVNSGDNFVLRFFVPLDKIGVYNFAYQFFKGILSLVFILSNYFLPFISENIENTEKMRAFYYKKRPKIFILVFAAIAVVFAFGPYLINRIYQNSYQGWVAVFRILLAGSVFVLYFALQCPILNALKKYRFISMLVIVQVIINIGLDVILVWRIGIIGSAIATAFACLCSTVIVEIYFRRNLKSKLYL